MVMECHAPPIAIVNFKAYICKGHPTPFYVTTTCIYTESGTENMDNDNIQLQIELKSIRVQLAPGS